jgi:outer membrane lipoprotein SlyB
LLQVHLRIRNGTWEKALALSTKDTSTSEDPFVHNVLPCRHLQLHVHCLETTWTDTPNNNLQAPLFHVMKSLLSMTDFAHVTLLECDQLSMNVGDKLLLQNVSRGNHSLFLSSLELLPAVTPVLSSSVRNTRFLASHVHITLCNNISSMNVTTGDNQYGWTQDPLDIQMLRCETPYCTIHEVSLQGYIETFKGASADCTTTDSHVDRPDAWHAGQLQTGIWEWNIPMVRLESELQVGSNYLTTLSSAPATASNASFDSFFWGGPILAVVMPYMIVERCIWRVPTGVVGTLDLELVEYYGNQDATWQSLLQHYTSQGLQGIQSNLKTRASIRARDTLGDGVAATVGCTLAGAAMATPASLLVTVAAMKLRDGVRSTAAVGKQSRGVDIDEAYQFGDVTRGLMASVTSASSKTLPTEISDKEDDDVEDTTVDPIIAERAAMEDARKRQRYGAAIGSNVGAIAGFALLGPVGLVAGAIAGTIAGQRTGQTTGTASDNDGNANVESDEVERHDEETILFQPCEDINQGAEADASNIQDVASQPATSDLDTNNSVSTSNSGYRFGDISRSIVARGKIADGRKLDSGYKFGDFTRGLFAKSSS